MSQSQTGNWSLVALISCRHNTSGCSRSMNSCTCACRARIPFTFQVATFIRMDRLYAASGTQLASAPRRRMGEWRPQLDRRVGPARASGIVAVGAATGVGGRMSRQLRNLRAGAMGAIAARCLALVEQRDDLAVVRLVDARDASARKQAAGQTPEYSHADR